MQNQHAYMNNHGGCILMFSYGGWLLSPPFSGIGAMHKNHLRQKICIYKTLRVTLNWSTMTKVPHHNYAGHSGSCYFVLHSSGVVTRLLWSWVCCHRQRGHRSQSQLSKRRRPEDTSNSFANVWSLFSKFGQADANSVGLVFCLLWSWVRCHRQRGHRRQSQLSKRRRQEAWSVDRSTSFAQVCLPSLVTQMQKPSSTDPETALQVETGNIPNKNLAYYD